LETVCRMFDRFVRYATVALALVLVACLDDPVGPSSMTVTLDGGSADTVWSGAPGEALPRIRIKIRDDAGHPVPGASVAWEAIGQRSGVGNAVSETNTAGEATAVWALGTNASEEQRLHITVQTRHHETELDVRARAVPYLVAGLHLTADSVLRVGDTLALHVDAIDPYGNVFPAPDVVTTVSDTTVASATGADVIGGPRRGRAIVQVASHGVATWLPLHVTQLVAAIVPVRDTLVFSSLGAQLPVAYVVRDDRGREILDTTAALSVTDTAVVRLEGTQLRSLTRGAASLQLQLGAATASVTLAVDQRIASLGLVRDTIRFDALRDTTTLYPVARDSLGFTVVQPAVVFQIQDDQVAQLTDPTLLRAVTPGVTIVTVRDPATGLMASVPVVVRQLVRTIDVSPVVFDALGDTITPAVTPRDRLGYRVADAVLSYEVSDSSVTQLGSGGTLHSAAPGHATLTIRDAETGTATTTDVTVQQRIAALALDVDTLAFDALHDASALAVVGRDRLGALVADASTRTMYRSTDSLVIAVASNGVAHSAGNGSALLIGESTDGPSDTVRVVVAQRVVSVRVDRDSVLLESLNAEQPVSGSALDRLGFVVATAPVSYAVEDSAIARVDGSGRIRAMGNGSTRVSVAADGFTVPVVVRVQQRAVRVAVPSDTIHFVALGDTQTVVGVALDSLGSPVAGTMTSVVVADPGVAATLDSTTLRAQENGITHATFAVAGVVRDVVVDVQQIATTLTGAVTFDKPIVTLPVGAVLPLACQAFDRNGFVVAQNPSLIATVVGTVAGATCGDVRIQRSGYDTLLFTLGAASTRIPVTVAVAPIASSPLGEFVIADTLPGQPGNTWAPSVRRNASGELEVYYTAFSGVTDSSGYTRGDLHRLVWLGGNQFRYDGVAIRHDDDICSPQGQGIENVVIVPRSDSIGWRMFYAAGSNKCYGWQVFSAVSADGRTWTKEPGVRLSNGGSGVSWPPWPAGEGMVVDRLPSGEWRMIVASFEHITPPETTKWQITEWRSMDQLDWTYVGPVLTTRDMPPGWQGSVYSPTIREIAPGLWRMLFTATDRAIPGGRDAVWSAVSTDRAHWQVEREVLGGVSSNLFYAALVDDQLVFIRQDNGGPMHLSIATVTMP